MRNVSVFVAFVALCSLSTTHAQAPFTGAWTSDFQPYRGAGLVPSPSSGQLDSDHWTAWRSGSFTSLGDTNATGQWARGVLTTPTTSSPSGLHAFQVAPGEYTIGATDMYRYSLHLENTSGASFGSVVRIDYTVHTHNLFDDRMPTRVCYRELTATVLTRHCDEIVYSADLAEPSPSWTTESRSFLVNLVEEWIPGRTAVIELGAANSNIYRDAFAYDDLTISIPPPCGNGILDPGETCDDGVSNGATRCGCSATCDYPGGGTSCRRSDGPCDLVEFCDGAGACPRDTVQPAGIVCRTEATDCDTVDFCDGSTVASDE